MRPRKRVCLEDGLRLDLNRLVADGILVSGAVTCRTIFWQVVGSRELVGVAVITADLTDLAYARVRIRMRGLDQTIELIAHPRALGGSQWYFRCPVLGLMASVLWKPPGARTFCSRQAWGKQVAYHTQFVGPARRARIGRERIRSRLSGDHKDADNWLLPPPKPKLMRSTTYEREIERYSRYEEVALKNTIAGWERLNAALAAKRR